MKKVLSIIMILAALMALCSCGKGPGAPADEPGEAGKRFSENEIPGVLLYTPFSLSTGDISALALSGDKAGSDALRSTAPANEGIRCRFELGERISFTLVCEGAEGEITAALVPHMDYAEYKHFSMDSSTASVTVPAAHETCGSLCADPAEAKPGCYDLTFFVNGKPTVMCYVRLYASGSLAEASDAELIN